MLGKHKLHCFCGLHFFAEYYIRFCNYYMFGVSSDTIHTDICACYSNVDLHIKYIFRNL